MLRADFPCATFAPPPLAQFERAIHKMTAAAAKEAACTHGGAAAAAVTIGSVKIVRALTHAQAMVLPIAAGLAALHDMSHGGLASRVLPLQQQQRRWFHFTTSKSPQSGQHAPRRPRLTLCRRTRLRRN